MPIKFIKPKDSDVFGSKATFKGVPKAARDTLFGTVTSQDWEWKQSAGRDENLDHVYSIGRYSCKYLPHPGKKVPLLTHHSCESYRNLTKKEAGDLEINNNALKSNAIAGKSGAKTPQVKMHDGRSLYLEDFRDFGARGRDAKPALVAPDVRCLLGVNDTLSKSLMEDTFRSRGSFARTEPWLRKDQTDKCDPKPDFYKSRQQVAHSKTAIGATAPIVCWDHGPKERLRRGEQSLVETFLEDHRKSIGRCQTAPHLTVPIWCVGSELR